MCDLQRRTSPRFALRYRAHVDYSLDGTEHPLECITKNISLGGVLLESPALIPVNCPLRFVIKAAGEKKTRQIQFKGRGEVVRVQLDPLGSGLVVAVRCVHPIEVHRAELVDETKAAQTSVSS
jgi:PilZ domain